MITTFESRSVIIFRNFRGEKTATLFQKFKIIQCDSLFSVLFALITFLPFYRQDELKIGTLVGTDEMGNRYYENNLYFYGNFLIIINS